MFNPAEHAGLPSDLRRGSAAVRWLPPIVVALVTVAVFLPALRCGFVSWDDDRNLLENAGYRGFDALHVRWMLTTFFGGHYQPLTWLSFAMDYQVWGGLKPVGFHLTNVLLHALAAVLFCLVAWRLISLAVEEAPAGQLLPIALASGFAALVFALHPLRVESVVWVTERRDVLSGVFFCACVLAYLRATVGTSPARGWHVLAWLMLLLSLLAKAAAMTLPLVLLVIDLYPARRLTRGGVSLRRLMLEKLPYLALALAAAVMAAFAQRAAGAWRDVAAFGWLERVVTACHSVCFYLLRWLVPQELSPLYPLPDRETLLAVPYLLAIPAALLVVASGGWLWRRAPAWTAAITCYLLLLAPVSGIAQSGKHLAADRYSYLALLPFAVLAGGVFLRLHRRTRIASIVAIGLVIVLSGLTIVQTRVWRDSESLWQRVYSLYPRSSVAAVNLGDVKRAAGLHREALTLYEVAAGLNPADAKAHNGRGVALLELGRPEEALAAFTRAIKLDPEQAGYYRNLGYTLAGFSRTAEAIAAYEQALQRAPADGVSARTLAALYEQAGRFADARRVLESGLAWWPEDRALAGNLAWLLATCPDSSIRDGPHALALAQELARKTDFADPWVLETLAAAYAETGALAQAAAATDAALKLARRTGDADLIHRLEQQRDRYRARASAVDRDAQEPPE